MNLTSIHTAISLIGIVTGFVVMFGFLTGKRFNGVTVVFLVTTVLTSATGFLFPFFGLLPSHIVGILSLVLLAAAIYALYGRHLTGPWRWIYVICAVASQYFNVFVLVVQGFKHVPALFELAPTQSEPPFAIAQGIVLLGFIALGVLSVKRFRPVA